MGLSGSRVYSLKSILNKYYINFSTPSLCGQNLFFSSERYNDENINIRSFRDETEVVEEKKGLNLTGAEKEAGAKSFMWLVAHGKPEKEILSTPRAGVRAVQGSSAPQMFSFGLKLAPALTIG